MADDTVTGRRESRAASIVCSDDWDDVEPPTRLARFIAVWVAALLGASPGARACFVILALLKFPDAEAHHVTGSL